MDPTHFESLYPTTTRFTEIEQLLAFIKTGNSAQIISLPGGGRSTMFGLLAYNRALRTKHLGENQKWFHFVIVNFSEARNKPLVDVTKLLFLSLVDSLRERKMSPKPASFAGEQAYEKANGFLQESLQHNDEMVLFQGLKIAIDLLAIEEELTVVFLFDRFEKYVPVLTQQFFTNLSVLRTRAKYRFSAVFSLNRPLEDIVEPLLFSDFSEYLAQHTVYLPLQDKPGLDFRINYIEKVTGKKINEKTLTEIISLTAGHSKLTRLAVETELATSHQLLATSFELKKYLIEQKTMQVTLSEIWKSLTPHEQNFLASSDLATSNQLQTKNNEYLENVGLLQNGKITISLFTGFIKQFSNTTMQQSNNVTIIYDKSVNEIKKGNILLSDKLTAAEFKLLTFLLDNKDRILERNEVITAVWHNQASIQGVTDQALDQLIFRLRHKIENDPNSPKYIQTIKGRGFRFTP